MCGGVTDAAGNYGAYLKDDSVCVAVQPTSRAFFSNLYLQNNFKAEPNKL